MTTMSAVAGRLMRRGRSEPARPGRGEAFRRARRHSAIVRGLKVVFPALSAGVLALYAVLFVRMAGVGEAIDRLPAARILPEHLVIQRPSYPGFTEDGGRFLIEAETAAPNLSEPNLVALNGITGTLTDVRSQKTRLVAKKGVFDSSKHVIELSEGIEIDGDSGLKAMLERATVRIKESVVVSKSPVIVELPSGTVRARQLTVRQKLREITFTDSVEAKLKASQPAPGPSGTPAPAASEAFGDPGQPIDVTAQRLDVNDSAKTALFSGNVKAVQGDSVLTTPELHIFYDGDTGAAGPATAPGGQAATLKRILAKEPVVLLRGNGDQVTGKTAEFDPAKSKASVTGDVVITSPPDRRATSDRAEFDQEANTALLSGTVVVTQGENVLRGRHLALDRNTGRTRLTAPASHAAPAGRIAARFYQREPKAGAAAGAKAEEKSSPITGQFKNDPKAPVDIDAVSLDVDDNQKTATFRGDVLAAQGELSVRSRELVAHYSGEAGLAGAPGGAGTGSSAELARIEARGDVVIKSANGQTAKGDWAKFDVKGNTAVVGGDVTLTQAGNIVRGSRLEIDLATGESVLKTETSGVPAKDGGVAVSATPGKNRPSATFFLDKMKEKAKTKLAPALEPKKTEPAAGRGATSSWDTTNQP